MLCSRFSGLSSTALEVNSFLQKPITKAALLVISLLFAGGSVASHYCLGLQGVVGFSVASGVFMAAFIYACIRSTRAGSIHSRPPGPTQFNPQKRKASDQETDYKTAIDRVKENGSQNPLDMNGEFFAMIPIIKRFHKNPEVMDYLVEQYSDSPRFLGMWVQNPCKLTEDVDLNYDCKPNKAVLAAILKKENIFINVVHYWLGSRINDGHIPVTFFVDLSEVQLQILVNEILKFPEQVIEGVLGCVFLTAHLRKKIWPVVSEKKIKRLQHFIISKLADKKPNIIADTLAFLESKKSSDASAAMQLNWFKQDIEECLTQEQIKKCLS